MNIYVKVHQDRRVKKGRITVEKATYSDGTLLMTEGDLYRVLDQLKKAIEESVEIIEEEDRGVKYVHKIYTE